MDVSTNVGCFRVSDGGSTTDAGDIALS
jgi:hypothetical protein